MSRSKRTSELPKDKARLMRRAVRLQWITIVHVLAAGIVLYLASGNSQAMKGAYLDDLMGLLPPSVYLIASRFDWREPNDRFPYGFHRALSIAFFWAALALIVLGMYIFIDSAVKLVRFEHPSIGIIEIFGQRVWQGWIMLPALAFSGIPQAIIGRMKMPLAEALNDKVLHADAGMNRADWLAAGAAAIGVVGIGFGIWWIDAVAAAFIGAEIIEEGYKHMKGVSFHLLGEAPTAIDYSKSIPLPKKLEQEATKFDWVKEARARVREEGRVYFGEVFVVPQDDTLKVEDIDEATERLYELDWRIQDLVITPVTALEVDSHLKGRVQRRSRGASDRPLQGK
jgi:cation diffusion facilitator family transporter